MLKFIEYTWAPPSLTDCSPRQPAQPHFQACPICMCLSNVLANRRPDGPFQFGGKEKLGCASSVWDTGCANGDELGRQPALSPSGSNTSADRTLRLAFA
jgi:hypothetical protein